MEIDAVVPDVPAEPRAVLEAVAGRRREMEEFLADLVRVETPSLEPETMAPAFELLRGRLEESGYRCRRRSGRETGGSLLATRRQRRRGEPSQLLLGHVDTVWPVGTLEGMPLQRDRARMRGPGVYDMKGGLTQTLFALQALRDLELDPEVEPVVFVNSDEEIGSGESDDIIRRLARIVDRTLVMEPSLGPSGKLKTARKGVHQYEVIVRGRAAHAGLNPEEGISAILELSYLIQRLFALNDTERGVSVNVGQIDGGMRPNVVAPQSRAWVDVRVPTRQDAERIDAAIHDLEPSRDDVTVEVRCPEDSRAPMVP
ncbi:MAG: M20/M25/M40 family metallo-hydrolase, partial [Gemmatimonadota bacterium]